MEKVKGSKKFEVKREMRTNPESEPAKVYKPRTATPRKVVAPEGGHKTSEPTPRDAERMTEQNADWKSTEGETAAPQNRYSAERGAERADRRPSTRSVERPRKRVDSRSSASTESYKREERSHDDSARKRVFKPSAEKPNWDKKPSRSLPSRETGRDTLRPRPGSYRRDDERKDSPTERKSPYRNDRPLDDRRGATSSRQGGFRKSSFEPKGDETSYRPRTGRPDSRYERDSPSRPAQSGKYSDRNSNWEGYSSTGKRHESSHKAEFEPSADGLLRLNKYISNSGLCSRREADEFIVKGQITVNGVVVTQLGTKVKPTDEICCKGKQLEAEHKVYILLNKPKDYITTVEDPFAKRTVMELIEGACRERVYPVGRLDRNSTGLLLLTNDGEMTVRLTHPSFKKKKIYQVGLDKPLATDDFKKIVSGIELDGSIVKVDSIEYLEEGNGTEIGIEIHTGQNRVVRRIFEELNYKVSRLDRVYFAGLTKKNLPKGKWRFLTQKEINTLRMNRFE